MSRSPDNILLHLAQEQEEKMREIFAQLAQRGFPVQQQTPHITITFSPDMGQEAVEKAAQLLPAVIPARFQRAGTVIFGTKRKQTVAWLLETSDELERAARQISAMNPDGRGERWTPHLTMGLRLPRDIVPNYIRALDEITGNRLNQIDAVRAVLWKPRLQQLRMLAGQPPVHDG